MTILSPTDRIGCNPGYDSTVVKIHSGRSTELSREELQDIENLKRVDNSGGILDDSDLLSFAPKVLKKAGYSTPIQNSFIDLLFLLLTSMYVRDCFLNLDTF